MAAQTRLSQQHSCSFDDLVGTGKPVFDRDIFPLAKALVFQTGWKRDRDNATE
jgi:hypothetical protein